MTGNMALKQQHEGNEMIMNDRITPVKDKGGLLQKRQSLQRLVSLDLVTTMGDWEISVCTQYNYR